MICRLTALACVGLFASSCATGKLWRLTDSGPVAISQSKVSEAEIREKGLSYRKDDEAGIYYVDSGDVIQSGGHSHVQRGGAPNGPPDR